MASETAPPAPGPAPSAPDAAALLRSRNYRAALVLAAVVGLVVSVASWAFLELVAQMQRWVYQDLPGDLGFETVPSWWPLPILGLAGILIALAITRLSGNGGHEPTQGLHAAPTAPADLPGIVLAAVASIGLGMVLGPEAPLIALGSGLGLLAVKAAKKDAPDELKALIAAAASLAAISSLFGSPAIAAVIIIEAAGLGGAMLPVFLLPGLLAAGIGSLVFVGMGSLTGLSTSDYALAPIELPAYAQPTVAAFLWTLVLAVVVAVVCFAMIELGRRVRDVVVLRPLVVVPVAALAVGALAVVFAQVSDEPFSFVLFSGQDQMDTIVAQGATLSASTLALIVMFKGLAYGISLGSARGGPTFPALFLGLVAGLLAAHLPGLDETPAVAALMGAATVAVLRLPLSSVILVAVVTQAGVATTPLVIVAVVVSYITVLTLDVRRAAAAAPVPPPGEAPVGPATQPA